MEISTSILSPFKSVVKDKRSQTPNYKPIATGNLDPSSTINHILQEKEWL